MAVKEIKLINAPKRPVFKAGDTVRVWQKVIDRVMEKDKVKEKIRSQAFEGLVLARKHGEEAGATFTVRRIIESVGVERIFPINSPLVEKIEVLRRSKVRRAKLYYIREKAAKEVRRQMKNIRMEKEEIIPEIPVEEPPIPEKAKTEIPEEKK
ncbi:MAG: 50S ribosomal protein L19 [Candidatus Paceibacterota bacterium]|jgi:large subunit ribosomal protein L19